VTITEPVRIEEGATVTDSYIGPNVVIGAGSVVSNCTLVDTIIGDKCRVDGATLTGSMLGDRVTVEGVTGSATLGDDAEVRAPR
jgi:glucose-1-phosphate thymidylyltransferase